MHLIEFKLSFRLDEAYELLFELIEVKNKLATTGIEDVVKLYQIGATIMFIVKNEPIKCINCQNKTCEIDGKLCLDRFIDHEED